MAEWISAAKELGLQGTIVVCFFLVLGWLLRTLFQHGLSADRERHKAELAKELEAFKGQLQQTFEMQRMEHEVRFRHIHERTVKVLSGNYRRFLAAFTAVVAFVDPLDFPGEPRKEGKGELAAQKIAEANRYLLTYRLYVPTGLFMKMWDFYALLSKTGGEFQLGYQRQMRGEGQMDHWTTAKQELESKAAPLFEQIHKECQILLGIEQAPQQTAAIRKRSDT